MAIDPIAQRAAGNGQPARGPRDVAAGRHQRGGQHFAFLATDGLETLVERARLLRAVHPRHRSDLLVEDLGDGRVERDTTGVPHHQTLERVQELAGQYLDPDRMIWLVVGDARTQAPRLSALGLGEPIMIDREGQPIG